MGERARMFDSKPPPQPAYWKALLFGTLVFGPAIAVVAGVLRLPVPVWIAMTAVSVPALAAVVHLRAKNDFVARGTMQMSQEIRHTVPTRRK